MASFGAGRHQPQLYDTIQVYFAALNQALEAFDGKRAAKLLGFDVISRQLAREFGKPVSYMAAYLRVLILVASLRRHLLHSLSVRPSTSA